MASVLASGLRVVGEEARHFGWAAQMAVGEALAPEPGGIDRGVLADAG